ncbi:hypothetical protein [Paenibacillus polymyxa]|uniref:hypothetical protein n=1 Tax=Paenibacillus polymyxa TaxID=1406 RepID=UPI002AB32F80|nr:hypothetical protein [Paenibacillus polymyxa]MDY8021087.1 hypothetical protein [Paenibacillus polymyxa]
MLKNKYHKQAFEIENVNTRKNYSYAYNPYDQSVCCYDTSINQIPANKRIMAFKDSFPFECATAYDYFVYIYKRSTSMKDLPWCFLGWVNPTSFKPIEDETCPENKEWELKVKKTLENKHQELLSMIENQGIKEIIHNNCYISGGCIASILRGEQPKDIDYFIKDLDSLNIIRDYFKSRHEIALKYQKECHRPITVLDGYDDTPLFFTDNAVTLCDDFQIILKDSGNPEEVTGKFDFVHCMGYYSPSEGKLFIKEEVRVASMDHNLIYNILAESPITTSYRMVKFIQRGWKINREEQAKLLLKVNKYELSKQEEESMSEIKYYDV